MGKKEKLIDLQSKISEKSERIKYLLQSILYSSHETLIVHKDDAFGIGVLACIASDENEKIEKMAEKLHKIIVK